MPSAQSVGLTRVRSDNHASAARAASTSPVLAAASASSETTSDPCPSCPCSKACQAASPGQVVERELKMHQSARPAGEPGLPGRQGMPGLEVPQLERDDLADS